MPNLSKKAEPILKSRILIADRTPAKEPILWKREGEALTRPGNPLANLTKIKLSRKKSGNFRPNVCGKYALQGSSRALYTLLDPTHKECTWPVPFQEPGYAVLIGNWVVKNAVLWSGGVIWTGGLDWRCWWDLMVWFCGRVLIWSGLWSDCLVWCSDGLVSWSDLELCLRKMVWSDGWKLKR